LVINIENICDRAVELFNPGGNCAESVRQVAKLAAETVLVGENTDA